ncbi:CaiB/BaiF CoA transferase family protein [Agrobacterium sp. MCAB5]|uniref:CaiB/BaiF CoA transferase family protein n=1 Tax=Agrobacterium sp. MCAB5 TaxID=3233042 RepID=UPI003F93CDA6
MSDSNGDTAFAGKRMPLEGVRVLDISNYLAAPTASMFLGDYGADVVKIERPGHGDEMRYWGNSKNGVGLYYKVVNRNKKSVCADLRTPLGVEIVKRLVKDVDIVVENYRTGTLEKWGLDYDVLSAINPGLVMLRITGYGQTGPNRNRPGFGTLAEAFSGLAYITGHPDRPPLLPGFGLGDASTGLMGAFLTMVALHEKKVNGGKGQVIDLALYETLYTLLGPQVVNYDQLGIIQQREGSRLPFTAPRNTYETRDGKFVAIAGSTQSIFERLCAALDVPDLANDPRFSDNRVRLENATELDVHLQKAISNFDLDDLLSRLVSFEAAVAPAYSVAETFDDPQFIARENVASIPDEELGGPLRMQNVVGKLSATPGKIRSTGPRLGEHNREVLIDQLGFSEDELRAAQIVV